MIDTHAHLNFSAFKTDVDLVIERAQKQVQAIINVGSQLSTSIRSVELAGQYENVFAAVGLHPIQLEDMEVEEEGAKFITRKEVFDYNTYKELAQNNKVVAIGETGLDYYHVPANSDVGPVIEKQKAVFREHIKLANELNLPLIVHTRGTKLDINFAYGVILEELKKNKAICAGVMHCYAGPSDLIKEFVDLGFYISFNGIITFDKTGRIKENLLATPDERILLETDCPYLTPAPWRGQRNEPAYLVAVCEAVAKIKGMEQKDLEILTDKNATDLFKIKVSK
jgi:TatD DNase family protein